MDLEFEDFYKKNEKLIDELKCKNKAALKTMLRLFFTQGVLYENNKSTEDFQKTIKESFNG